ncbi:hypothetical protein F2P81_005041 [Scophthalmus maximus]|uniref:Uncharacterized protein n=1 Tax=Scophthalmus maximus TaxID=52904 RepID=A0A6A4TKF4_SCOMX|nr:hypothetical protein F2P81_005041 [Scophthalmus maximus]
MEKKIHFTAFTTRHFGPFAARRVAPPRFVGLCQDLSLPSVDKTSLITSPQQQLLKSRRLDIPEELSSVEQLEGILQDSNYKDTDLEACVKGVDLGILTTMEDNIGRQKRKSIAPVIEEQIVLNDVCDFTTAFALLFGLYICA